jgi:hypothetical protein
MEDTKVMSIDEEIELFFKDPGIRTQVKDSSTLHLLRRDIYSCMGYINDDNKNEWIKCDKKKDPTRWPGAMVILAGIDLLGKFYDGNDKSCKVANRFKAYYNKYIAPYDKDEYNDKQNAEIIYQLRNSLLHSFGLYSKDTFNFKIYHFNVCINNKKLIEEGSDTIIKKEEDGKKYTILFYRIDIGILHDLFEGSIEKYKSDLMEDKTEMKNNFHNMFKNYGNAPDF